MVLLIYILYIMKMFVLLFFNIWRSFRGLKSCVFCFGRFVGIKRICCDFYISGKDINL